LGYGLMVHAALWLEIKRQYVGLVDLEGGGLG
jgi:hypothetical protein